jgi:hypothetical protein
MTAKRTKPAENRCQLRFADGRRCALPAHPQGDGLCYPHAHAPPRRLRPYDLTRELTSLPGATVSDAKIHRLLAKLPAAVADDTISPSDAHQLEHLCNLMLQCSRLLSATKLPADTDDPDWNFVATLLNDDDDQDDAEIAPITSHR